MHINMLIEFQITKHVNIKKISNEGVGSTFDRKVRETLYKELTLWPEISVMRRPNHKKIQFPHKGSEEEKDEHQDDGKE